LKTLLGRSSETPPPVSIVLSLVEIVFTLVRTCPISEKILEKSHFGRVWKKFKFFKQKKFLDLKKNLVKTKKKKFEIRILGW